MSGYQTEDIAHDRALSASRAAILRNRTLVLLGWAVVDDPRGGFMANVRLYTREKGKNGAGVTIPVRCPEPRTADMDSVVAAEIASL